MLPSHLEARIRTPEFWDEYFFVDEEADQWDPWELRFPLGAPDRPLRLSIDAFGYISLTLDVGGTALEIAWDDPAHWHPHGLRWVELEAIGRQVETHEPRYAHPGITLLLLARFAPILTSADAELALPLIDAAGVMWACRLRRGAGCCRSSTFARQ